MKNGILSALLIIAMLLPVIFSPAKVGAVGMCLDDTFTDTATSGWSFHNGPGYDHIHSGVKEKYYHFRSEGTHVNDRTALINYVTVAVDTIWNGDGLYDVIEFVEDSTMPNNGEVYREPNYDDLNTIASAHYDETCEHTAIWYIVVNTPAWMAVEPSHVRSRIMAHEIGHIYGLGHTDSTHSDYIMKPANMTANDWVRAAERKAVELLSHQHTCSSFTYVNHNTTQHRKLCSYCKAYTLQSHTMPSTWTDYSSTKHRKTCTKNCGYYTEANHSYTSATWFQYSSTHHGRYCTASGCNRINTAPHTWEYHGTVAVCTVCGYAKDLMTGLEVEYPFE